MATAASNELVERFEQFFRDYYRDEIGELARKFPTDRRSLYVDWQDLYRFDPDLADDYLSHPEDFREKAEEALRLYDLPVDVKLGGAHVRLHSLPETTEIRALRSRHVNTLIAVSGLVRKATDVKPKIQNAAFECQRCGTLTRVPQSGTDFQEPHECQGCERQGPFRLNVDQSEFVDAQSLRIQESPEGLQGGETPRSIDVRIEDDLPGDVTPGDHVTVTGVLRIDQGGDPQNQSAVFETYMDGVAVEIEDEQFEEMEITEEDKKEIVRLSDSPDIYERMVDSIAPSIYGYEEQKLAMAFQLFSGVTKHLPDGTRLRGDLHILFIGDPGTGKSQLLQYVKQISPRAVYTSGKGASSAGLCVTGDTMVHTADGFVPIREIATDYHPDPVDEETAARAERELYTYDRRAKEIKSTESSHVWRMPEKPCREIETAHGKRLEASTETPLLVCGEDGIKWKPISDVEPGDRVAVPKYEDLDRNTPQVRDFIEFTEEKLRPTDDSVAFLQRRLREEFGTLRDAAEALDLPESFIYDSLSNRHLPLDRLDRILDAIGAELRDIEIDRAMLRHGDGVTIPDAFDEDLLYLVGLVFGDGDVMVSRRGENRGHVRISNSDEALLRTAADVIERTFGKSVEVEYQDDRVPCIRLHSATVARFFGNLGVESPKDDIALDPRLTTAEHADAFLRGLFDADGCVSPRDDGGSSVQFSTTCPDLARQVPLMLESYGIRARRRERDRQGTYELANGREVESTSVQTHLTIYGKDIDRFADTIGFGVEQKANALSSIVGDTDRRGEELPVGSILARTDGGGRRYYHNFERGDDPTRSRAKRILADRDLGEVSPVVEEVVDADLVWDEVVSASDTDRKEVFDLTVPETHNFVGNGIVTHNTAAAIKDDFGDGQQWSLEAGALVLADQGIAAVDELDKMRCVTGDTLVHCGDGSVRRIDDIARTAAKSGEIERLDNGRTIRDVDLEVYTMADDGRIVERPVTAVHEYGAPEDLREVTVESGESVTATADHPFFVLDGDEKVERPADDLSEGDQVYVPRSLPGVETDGGVVASRRDPGSGSTETGTPTELTSSKESPYPDVACQRITSVESVSPAAGDARDEDPDHCRPNVYDLTVEGTHNFVANGLIIHNSEDRSAMHQALEQQEISISKAGINATLKSRCALLGAANPKYGRFDQYEPIGEQIDLEPALISRFDLIFTVTDQPDEEEDRRLAEHILTTNYAGELNTQRTEMVSPDVSREEVESFTDEVDPDIDPDLFRKYVAYAKQNCHPRMTEAARERIKDFYTDLRAKGTDEDAPVPVTARKLEAIVRLAEASARIRLSDEVTEEDAKRVIDIVRSCLQDVGVDPESGDFDADIVETGTSKSQRDRIKSLKGLISDIEEEYEDGAPVEVVLDRAGEIGLDPDKAEHEIDKLKQKGEVYEPSTDHLRTT